jgi:cytochrome c peroxidase
MRVPFVVSGDERICGVMDMMRRFALLSSVVRAGGVRALLVAWLACGAPAASADSALSAIPAIGPLPMSLAGVLPPAVPGLLDGPSPVVVNREKAIVLGKALFWDTTVGSDGMACASCHFHAGADRRQRNQVAPGGAGQSAGGFEPGVDGAARGANYALRKADFPFTEVREPLRETAQAGFLRQSDDVAGSAGTFGGDFRGVDLAGPAADECERSANDAFHVRGVGARSVTRRNAPSVFNAVFNHRNFWDGRANNVFNGESMWGPRDAGAGVWVKQADGSVRRERLALPDASLASQAVAPAVDGTEMSCAQRTHADIGRKLLLRRPLERQRVHPEDSVLGAHAYSTPGTLRPGLRTMYLTLVRQAFNPKYWAYGSRGEFGAPPARGADDVPLPYSQTEANFGLFFAVALQMYQSTLVSDDSPFDRSRRDEAGLPIDLSPSQIRGFQHFRAAHCAMCHIGPLFTSAAVTTNAGLARSHPSAFGDAAFRVSTTQNVVDRGRNVGGNAFNDTGFAATGVGAESWDRGVGGFDAFGNPLSYSVQFLHYLAGDEARVVDAPVRTVRACDLSLPLARNGNGPPFMFTQRDGVRAQPQPLDGCFNPAGAWLPVADAAARELQSPDTVRMLALVEGAFKVPGLRNVELTGPYMHNGSMSSLEQVVEFYARGGNFEHAAKPFGFVFPQTDLQTDAQARADLIAFLKALTDERVRYQRAPFDHPEISVPAGHAGDHFVMRAGNALGSGLGMDVYETLPALGAHGSSEPLKAFEEYLDD